MMDECLLSTLKHSWRNAMSINYDPDQKPMITEEMLLEAERLRMHPANVICDEPGVQAGE